MVWKDNVCQNDPFAGSASRGRFAFRGPIVVRSGSGPFGDVLAAGMCECDSSSAESTQPKHGV
jgi:hypothetical protein